MTKFMPMIMAIVVPSIYLRSRYISPYSQYGKAIRGFPGHLTGSGRLLPEIDIEIRYIVQVQFSCPLIAKLEKTTHCSIDKLATVQH